MAIMMMKFPLQKRVRLAQGLWLMSWLAVMCGALTFCLGVYLKAELFRRAEVMENSEIHVVPNILILVGLSSIGANWVAGRVCQDSLDLTRYPRWKRWLLPWYAGVVLICSMLISSVILSYALQGRLEESIKMGLRNGIRFYRDTDVPGRCFQKETIDRLQMDLHCCGNNNFRDWFEVQWISNRYLDFTTKAVNDRIRSNVVGRYLIDGVPFSCCNPASPRPCLQYQLLNNNAHFNYEFHAEELNLFMRGCRQALVDYYMGLMNAIGPAILSFFAVQASVGVSLRYLQTSVEGAMALENPEEESEGYILENSVKETIEKFKEKVLAYLKLGEVKPGDEGGDAEKAASS